MNPGCFTFEQIWQCFSFSWKCIFTWAQRQEGCKCTESDEMGVRTINLIKLCEACLFVGAKNNHLGAPKGGGVIIFSLPLEISFQLPFCQPAGCMFVKVAWAQGCITHVGWWCFNWRLAHVQLPLVNTHTECCALLPVSGIPMAIESLSASTKLLDIGYCLVQTIPPWRIYVVPAYCVQDLKQNHAV